MKEKLLALGTKIFDFLILIFKKIFAFLSLIFDKWVNWMNFPEFSRNFQTYWKANERYREYYKEAYVKYFVGFGGKVLASLVIGFVIYALLMKRTNKHADGLNSWHGDVLKKRRKDFVNGIVFGKLPGLFPRWVYSPADDKFHVGVFAGTGQGKTYTVGRPTLEHWDGTSFVIDISGDISSNVEMENKIAFTPGEDGAIYSPFGVIDALESDEKKEEALQALAFLLIPEKNADGGSANYFEEGGRKILQASLLAFYFAGMDFCDICKKIKSSDYITLFEEIDKSQSPIASMLINGFANENEKNIGGCKGQCDRAIDLFATNAGIARTVRRAEDGETVLTPEEIERSNIFICVDDNRLSYYAPLVSIITSQMMEYVAGREVTRYSKKILIMLDEFKSLNLPAKMINDALAKYRKKNCRVMILTQSLADLKVLYGKEQTEALLTNLDFKILLGGLNDNASANYFADFIGYKKVKHETASSSHNDYGQFTHGKTTSESREYVIEPADFDNDSNTVFVLHKKIAPYHVARLRKVHRVSNR